MSLPPLRPYQRRDTDEILAALQRREDPLYGLPTGGGKTRVKAEVIGTVTAQGWETWLFVHRPELLRQASATLEQAGIPHGWVHPDYEWRDAPVQVASIDTVHSRLDALRPRLERARLAAVDEAHHIAADTWAEVVRTMPRARRLGVTATCYRLDGRGLGEFFSRAVRGPSIRELIDLGCLAPPAVWAPATGIDLSRVRKVGGDYALADLRRIMTEDRITALAVRWYTRLMPGVPTVVFCVDVEHARQVAAAFTAAGWDAASVDGTTDPDERRRLIGALGSGELQILTSCMIISEGTDIPIVGGAILLRPTASTGLYLQQVGRVLRVHLGKERATIIDLAANVATHGMPDAERPWTLEGGILGLERRVPATARCQRCAFVIEAGPRVCPECGAPMPAGRLANPMLASMPGVGDLPAFAVAGMTLVDVMPHVRSRQDLERVARIRGYDTRWVRQQAQSRRLA